MERYYFEAKNFKGETKTGFLEAEDLHQLASILKKEGLILIQARPERKKRKIYFFSFGVPLSEKIFFTKNLQIMISAGVPIVKAISSLAQQTKNKKFKKILEKINQDIIKGSKLSDSLANFPTVFNEFYQNMIRVSEETGNLEEVLKILTNQMEKEHEVKTKIKGAMIYPAVIVLAMIGIGILMLVIVVPKLAATFEELEIELPVTTKLVIFLGKFLAHFWYLLILGIIFFVFFIFQISKIKIAKKFFDKIFLKTPLISDLIRKQNAAYFARNLSSLISGGVSLPRALEITGNTLGNVFFKEASYLAAERVKKGEKLSQILKDHQKIFPLTLIHMIEVGEETGETSQVLEKLAEFYEQEITETAKNLTSIIEPILLLIIGGVVGFFAISMIQPIYSMMQAFK